MPCSIIRNRSPIIPRAISFSKVNAAHTARLLSESSKLKIWPGILFIFKLADEEVGAGELSRAVDDVEKEGTDPEHGVDPPSVPSRLVIFAR